mgnify:CR=1 FL=1
MSRAFGNLSIAAIVPCGSHYAGYDMAESLCILAIALIWWNCLYVSPAKSKKVQPGK